MLTALWNTNVPVPKVHLLCDDESIIGQMFYVMEHVQGRVYGNLLMPEASPSERNAVALDLARVLADLHSVNIDRAGLSAFGKSAGYLQRQIVRWSSQYSTCGFDTPAMNSLMSWLPDHIPSVEEATITHGDYRLGMDVADKL